MGDPYGNAALLLTLLAFLVGAYALWPKRDKSNDCPRCRNKDTLLVVAATPEFWVFRCIGCGESTERESLGV